MQVDWCDKHENLSISQELLHKGLVMQLYIVRTMRLPPPPEGRATQVELAVPRSPTKSPTREPRGWAGKRSGLAVNGGALSV